MRDVTQELKDLRLYGGSTPNAAKSLTRAFHALKRRFLSNLREKANLYRAKCLPNLLEKHSWNRDSKNMIFENTERLQRAAFHRCGTSLSGPPDAFQR